jgi:hypothetical protein
MVLGCSWPGRQCRITPKEVDNDKKSTLTHGVRDHFLCIWRCAGISEKRRSVVGDFKSTTPITTILTRGQRSTLSSWAALV